MSEEEKSKTWVIGVSGGADSMALLHMCHRANIKVMVAHMNYQKRASADRDMEGVRAFCQSHSIPIEIAMPQGVCTENFQAFARKQRYAFYREVLLKYQAYGVLVAHHKDDHIETYLMQKQQERIPSYYGIARSVTLYDCLVVRPLLSYTKAQLVAYCEENKIEYYQDESNFSDDYTRNRIRHEYIDHMTLQEKEELCEQIVLANIEREEQQSQNEQLLADWDHRVDRIKQLDFESFVSFLQYWLFSQCGIHSSKKECNTIYNHIHGSARNWTRPLDCAYDMRMEYGLCTIIKHESRAFAYTYEHLCFEETPYFRMDVKGSSTEAVTLEETDFPITIRCVQPGDKITMRFGTKSLNRWFIDRKIPKEERLLWPIVVNASNKIILVPKLGCDISHFSNNPNLFVIK